MSDARWRRVVLASATGSVVCGWLPATVATAVNQRLNIHGTCHTVLSLDPSVERIEEHPGRSLPTWADATPWRDEGPLEA